MNSFEILTNPTSTNEEKREAISELTRQRLCQLLGKDEVPTELEYIYNEVCIKRFNRLGNEGMDSFSQEGMTLNFSNSDFDEFQVDIDNWLNNNKKKNLSNLSNLWYA